MTDPMMFAIVGAGWRSEFFLRIAREFPERFRVTGVMTRRSERAEQIEAQWGTPAFGDMDGLLREQPDFVVTSVPRNVNAALIRELAARGHPVLSETPPAAGIDELNDLCRFQRETGAAVQVAEQYIFQPLHAARLAIVGSGKLGTVSQAQVSLAHGYHGVSLLRRFLGIGFEDAVITARTFRSPLIGGPGRGGAPREEKLGTSGQTIATLDFGDRLGIFDHTGDQYHSWIRSQRLLVRGERGEINNREVRYLQDFQTPVMLELTRRDTGQEGNLEGYYHAGILAGAEWVYSNPFVPGRLNDDEIAVATSLAKMGAYARGEAGDFYPLAEAAQDHYLAMCIDQAARDGAPVRTEPQSWAS